MSEKTENENFYGVALHGQSYLNILYLLSSFPLGLFYFVFLVAGFSVGVALSIILIGLPILLLMLVAARVLVAFERQLAIRVLDADIPPISQKIRAEPGIWARLIALLTSAVTWKGLFYLFAKFPFGIFSFVVSLILIVMTIALVGAPIMYQFPPFEIALWQVDTQEEALLCSLIGAMLGLVSLHLMNGLASLWRRFARLMLRDPRSAQPEPERHRPIIIP